MRLVLALLLALLALALARAQPAPLEHDHLPPVGEQATLLELERAVRQQPYNPDRTGVLATALAEEGYLKDALAMFKRQVELLVDTEEWSDVDPDALPTTVGLQLPTVLKGIHYAAMALHEHRDAHRALDLAHAISPLDAELRESYIKYAESMGLPRTSIQLQLGFVAADLVEKREWGRKEALRAAQHVALELWATGLEDAATTLARSLLGTDRPELIGDFFREHCRATAGVDAAAQSVRRADTVRLLAACALQQGVLPMLVDEMRAQRDAANVLGFAAPHAAAALGAPRLRRAVSEATGVPLDAPTDQGMTALHVAVVASAPPRTIKELVADGASPLAEDQWGRTPADIAGLRHDAETAALLVSLGSPEPQPQWDPARPFLAAEAPPPGALPEAEGFGQSGGYRAGSGALVDFDGCEMDTLALHELKSPRFISDYLSVNRPFRLRAGYGAVFRHLRENWALKQLRGEFGGEKWELGAVPYAGTFNMTTEQMTLREYVRGMRSSSSSSEEEVAPYLFVSVPAGHRLRRKYFRLPQFLQAQSTNISVSNMQFYVGAEGSGAPVHWHEAAWNMLVYGEKFWALFPRDRTFYSKKPAGAYFAAEGACLTGAENACAPESDEAHALRCVQRPGDLLYVPESWGHVTLNLAESVGMASEFSWGARVFVPGIDEEERTLLARPVPPPSSRERMRIEMEEEESRSDEPEVRKGNARPIDAARREAERRPEDANENWVPPSSSFEDEWGGVDSEL